MGIDPAAAAAFDDRVADGAALTGLGVPMKSQFFLPMAVGRMAYSQRLLSNLDAAVPEVNAEGGPLAGGVVDGLAEQALPEMAPAEFEPGQGALEAGDERPALMRARTAARRREPARRSRSSFSMR